MEFLDRHHARRRVKEALRHAHHLFHMREDLFSHDERNQLLAAISDATNARKAGDIQGMDTCAAALNETVCDLTPAQSMHHWRGSFETWVTALAVAMAFRAYFYQPFRIPTGSMWPTLSGIYSVTEEKQWYDSPLMRVPSWLVTGSWYRTIMAKRGGRLEFIDDTEPGYRGKPGYITLRAGGQLYFIPNDIVYTSMNPPPGMPPPMHKRPGDMVSPGDVIWAGRVTLGDFVFVNRWAWNFRRPKRGEVMVFSTEGINGLPKGTHYIKRMCGLPNETIRINPPYLVIDGEITTEPRMINLISSQGRLPNLAAHYPGFKLGTAQRSDVKTPRSQQLLEYGDTVELGPDKYYALGDNSDNSLDSRNWGPVPERNLIGPGSIVYWPFKNPRWGKIP